MIRRIGRASAPARAVAAALALFLVTAAVLAQGASTSAPPRAADERLAGEYYWEDPRGISPGRGRFLSALPVPGGLAAIWQESEDPSGANSGRIWLAIARMVEGRWSQSRRFAGPFDYRGSEPILYSAAVAAGGRIAVAVADGEGIATGGVAIFLSSDGGRSFERSAVVVPEIASVAPRVYASASGGWILFVAQGAEAETQAGSLQINVASSADGRRWTGFSSLVAAEEGLGLSLLPAAAALPAAADDALGDDIVIFQSLVSGNRPSWQLYSKRSADGGRTWSTAKRVTDFPDPVRRDNAEPENYDNQRPNLGVANGTLWMAWERNLRGGSPQIYMASFGPSGAVEADSADLVSSGSGICSDPQVLDLQGEPGALWYDSRRGANRVYMVRRRDAGWNEYELSVDSSAASFGRAVPVGADLYALWQSSPGGADRIVVREPDTSAAAPRLSALDFTEGKRSRSEKVNIEVGIPRDSSGIAGFAYVWGRDPAAAPARGAENLVSRNRLTLGAEEDGPWYLAAAVQDFAGNWSAVSRIRFDRKRTPPDPPILMRPETDEAGFVLSNSLSVEWQPPDDEFVAGYSWELRYAGPLETTASQAAYRPRAGDLPPILGLTAYESTLIQRVAMPALPPKILTTEPRASWWNLENGYYLVSVAAIDDVGNMSGSPSILIKANKYVPYTTITYVDALRDELGRTTLEILGRGYLAEGAVSRIALDRDGREPFDIERSIGEYRILSDRQIAGFVFEDAEQGSYRVGLFHPRRGWYWTKPVITVDEVGTVKYGLPSPFGPLVRPVAARSYRFSVYDAFVLAAMLFAGLGVALSIGQTLSAARDGAEVRRQVLALVNGGPMPSAEKDKARARLKRRGVSLRVKFTLTIASLVMFVILLIALPLGYNVLATESKTLASSLQERTSVLLESVAQGGRSYMPGKDVLQLGFLPQQARAMDDAAYITVTGYGDGTTEPDSVWATNDKSILDKIDGERLTVGASRIVSDALSPDLPRLAAEIDARAATEVNDINAAISDLTREGRALQANLGDPAAQARFDEITQTLTSLQSSIDEKLFAVSTASEGSTPAFDPSALSLTPESFLFYKPIMYRSVSDQLYYRGMVRLEVSTELIVRQVVEARSNLIRSVLIVAAAALAVGLAGAFILSAIIVVPIKQLVRQIETIRDTEDMESLEGSTINVKSHD